MPPRKLGSTDYNSYCASVSDVAGAETLINPNIPNSIRSAVFINQGNIHCTVTRDIVNHEFGHALGFNVHFDVSGNAKSPDNFWDVQATL